MRRIVLGVSLLGVLLFGGAFALSWLDPLLVERLARDAVRIEVERRVGHKIDALSDARVAGFARRALGRGDAEMESVRQALRGQVPARVAQAVASMLERDCECRKRLTGALERAYGERLSSLSQARERLAGMIESSYASVAGKLLRELRIVTGCNALAFAALGLITLARRRTALQLLLPAAVLMAAVAVTGGLYLLRQDWLHTLVFGDYVGMAYAGYLAAVTALLADVAINRARITTRVVNGAMQAVGAVPVAIPC